jgi:tagatose 1,6-diphosphate aldolase
MSSGTQLSAGKWRGLMTLADDRGVFKMIAVDQHASIVRSLSKRDQAASEVPDEELAKVKTLLTRTLAPHATAVLLDPIWTYSQALPFIPGDVGIISSLESPDHRDEQGERLSFPLDGWSVAKAKRAGANAVKVLVWDRPDSQTGTRAHQEAFVRAVGEACRQHDLPFILQLLIYPQSGEEEDTLAYAKARPERILASVKHYAREEFGIDLLKLQFPADLKYCAEYAGGTFDQTSRESVYTLDDVRGYLRDLHASTHVPWVLLSAGVGSQEFFRQLELACAAGASGFLAGRAIWLNALEPYPDLTAIEIRLAQASLPYLQRISELAGRAKPWRVHPRYGNKMELAHRGHDWYRRY